MMDQALVMHLKDKKHAIGRVSKNHELSYKRIEGLSKFLGLDVGF